MIDLFALGLTHGLMLLAAVQLLLRSDLDDADDRKVDESPENRG